MLKHLRAAVIHAFEFTYELSWKMLKRYFAMTYPNPQEIQEMSFPQLIRTGCEHGLLLSEWEAWKNYREERGATSHTYNEDKANEVINHIPAFLQDAKYLFAQLKARTT